MTIAISVGLVSGIFAVGIDWAALKARLDECLLPEHLASGPDALPDLPDPFPVWRRAEAAA